MSSEFETTGTVVKASKNACVVLVAFDTGSQLLSFRKSKFRSFGLKCDGDLTNIVEEGMQVELCIRTFSDTTPQVVIAWLGDRPDVDDEVAVALKPVYDQQGVLSGMWRSDYILESDCGIVVVNKSVLFRDDQRFGALTTEDEVGFDAEPVEGIHARGAVYKATCAWVGCKPPVVDRFKLKKRGNLEANYELVTGTVVVVLSEVVAVVDVGLTSAPMKVLVFRSSFKETCNRVDDVVDVGDKLRLRIKYGCLFGGRKQWFAEEASKIDVTFEETCGFVETLNTFDVVVPVYTGSSVAGGSVGEGNVVDGSVAEGSVGEGNVVDGSVAGGSVGGIVAVRSVVEGNVKGSIGGESVVGGSIGGTVAGGSVVGRSVDEGNAVEGSVDGGGTVAGGSVDEGNVVEVNVDGGSVAGGRVCGNVAGGSADGESVAGAARGVKTESTGVNCELMAPANDISYLLCDWNWRPLEGVISRYMSNACILYGNCKIFLDKSNFYVYGKHVGSFDYLVNREINTVSFEAAVMNRKDREHAQFSHEALCAWVGKKPRLGAVLGDLPPPRFYLPRENTGVCYYGIVKRIYLPSIAVVVVPGKSTTVCAHVRGFNDGNVFNRTLITRFVQLGDCVQFLLAKPYSHHTRLLWACKIHVLDCSQEIYDDVCSGHLPRGIRVTELLKLKRPCEEQLSKKDDRSKLRKLSDTKDDIAA